MNEQLELNFARILEGATVCADCMILYQKFDSFPIPRCCVRCGKELTIWTYRNHND